MVPCAKSTGEAFQRIPKALRQRRCHLTPLYFREGQVELAEMSTEPRRRVAWTGLWHPRVGRIRHHQLDLVSESFGIRGSARGQSVCPGTFHQVFHLLVDKTVRWKKARASLAD